MKNTSPDHKTAQTVLVQNIWRFYQERNLVKLKCIYAHLNITSILLNAVIAVSKLSDMLCFVETAFLNESAQ